MLKAITVCSHPSAHLEALKQSAIRHGIDLHVIETHWKGFGTKIIAAAEYLRTLEGYSYFVFVDAYDTLFQAPIKYDGGILFSTEKHRWPDADAPYPKTKKVWAYLNSGSYIAPVKDFLELVEKHPVKYEDDDQRYFTDIYLNSDLIKLDTECEVFQSYAFSTPDDFTITDRLYNNITKTTPSVIHFNGKCHDSKIYNMQKYSTISDIGWKQTPEDHQRIHEGFIEKVNDDPELKAHRDFVEQHIFGFGERSFQWMWNLLIQEMPAKFTFMEIGVFKGQTLSLCELLSKKHGKQAKRYGVTPLSTEGGVWDSDYKKDIELIHDTFELAKYYTLLHGLSEDPEIIKQASKLKLDILYIDGGHEERHIRNDIENYAHLVKPGGYLVIDDCCNSFSMPFGYFQGIEPVTRVVDELLPISGTKDWEFVFSVVHNRVYKRK